LCSRPLFPGRSRRATPPRSRSSGPLRPGSRRACAATLVFPFLFRALGYDADAEGISIVECGGKPNIVVIAEVCNAVGVPYLIVHDRNAEPGHKPIASERAVNDAIERVAGRARTIELARDFEAVAQLHGHRHKPDRATQWFALATSADDVPPELAEAVRRAVDPARSAA
jgi:hypothetical protein